MQEIHIFVSGTVQGVGFRSIVRRHALLHNITGYVRNLSDGRVEICAQGHSDQIDQFIHTIQTHPGSGIITGIEKKYKPSCEAFSSFEVH